MSREVIPPIRPGDPISAPWLNHVVEGLQRGVVSGPGVISTGAGTALANYQPTRFVAVAGASLLVEVETGVFAFAHAFFEAVEKPGSPGTYERKPEGTLGTVDRDPLFDVNSGQIAPGTVVEAWRAASEHYWCDVSRGTLAAASGFWAKVGPHPDLAGPPPTRERKFYSFHEVYGDNSVMSPDGLTVVAAPGWVQSLALPLGAGQAGVLAATELQGRYDVPEGAVVWMTLAANAPPMTALTALGAVGEAYEFRYDGPAFLRVELFPAPGLSYGPYTDCGRVDDPGRQRPAHDRPHRGPRRRRLGARRRHLPRLRRVRRRRPRRLLPGAGVRPGRQPRRRPPR